MRIITSSFTLILFFLITITHSLYTHTNNQELFLEANAFYHEHNYQKALNQYQKIEKKGWAVLYNMGNCYYMLNDYPKALVYWKQALSHGGTNASDAIQHNCTLVEKKLDLTPDNASGVKALLTPLSNKFPLIIWQLLFLILLYVTIFAFKRLWINRLYALFILCTFLLIIGLLLIHRWRMETTHHGIILEHAHLCSGTDLQFKKNERVNPGQEVKIIDERPDWVHIRDPKNNIFGWIKKPYIEYI